MTEVTPSQQTWTLRLKAHKTTVFLHVDPLTRFSVIKQLLYKALQDTSLNNPETNEPVPLPESAADIQLGRPVNINDPRAGFQLGEWECSIDEDEEDVKGKGKAKKTADGTAAPSNIQQCPKGAGLRDNAVLAFGFRGDGTEWGSRAQDAEDEDMEEDRPGMWGVKIPTFEDAYGVENEGDVGGGNDFDG